MPDVEVREMLPTDEYFVSTCSHVNESDEIDACGRGRLAWLREMHGSGMRVKVALVDGEHAGFAYVMPIEVSPWGPLGTGLAVTPCLWVVQKAQRKGAGSALMEAAEQEASSQGMKGIATIAFHHDFWFMPAAFFEKRGYSVARSQERASIIWKRFDPSAEAPSFLEPRYEFVPVPGRVVIDLFWNTFCETSWIEAQRVKEVAADFGDAVVLHEYCADDREILVRHQLPRGVFVNGEEISWGYEAPKEGVAEAISLAIERSSSR
jgi:GNAT superfamily N-acetyltransferase